MDAGALTTRQKMCIAVPMIVLGAAHWFPWKRVLGHKLHRLEAYSIGTATIVGTAAVAIARGDESSVEKAELLLLTAASAGFTTLGAWALDMLLLGKSSEPASE